MVYTADLKSASLGYAGSTLATRTKLCIVSSAVERRPYKANVSGSTPLRCTKYASVV